MALRDLWVACLREAICMAWAAAAHAAPAIHASDLLRRASPHNASADLISATAVQPEHLLSQQQPPLPPALLAALADIVAEMRAGALEVRDRTYHLRRYRSCFLGCDAVQWLISHGHATDVMSALAIGDDMIRSGLIKHVAGEHMLENKRLFYRFTSVDLSGTLHATNAMLSQQLATALEALEAVEASSDELESRIEGSEHRLAAADAIAAHSSRTCTALLVLCWAGWLQSLVGPGMTSFLLSAVIGALLLNISVAHIRMPRLATGTQAADLRANKASGAVERQPEHVDQVQVGQQTLPPVSIWPHRPVLARLRDGTLLNIRAKEVLAFDNELFEGKIMLLLKGLQPDIAYFRTRTRVSAAFVQGRFRRATPCCDVLTGQAFERPLSHLPSRLLLRMLFSFLSSIAPGLEADVTAERPYLLTPLMAAAQSVCASEPNQPPDLRDIADGLWSDDQLEQTQLLGGLFASTGSVGVSRERRRQLFSKRVSLEKFSFDPLLCYTFGFWQSLFDPTDFTASLPFGRFDTARYMSGQPMLVMAKCGVAGKELWGLEMWHEKLLPPDSQHPRTMGPTGS